MVRGVLLLSWLLLFLVGEKVSAGAKLSQRETAYGLSPHVVPHTVEADNTIAHAAASSQGGLVTGRSITNQTAQGAPRVPHEVAPNKRRLGRTKKRSSLRIPLRKLSTFCVLLLCAALAAAAIRARPPAVVPDEEKLKELQARLERVKDLLPAARILAVAVDSAKSRECLKHFKETVEESDIAAEGRNVEALETSLTKALKVLRSLHRDALEEADKIVQADKAIPELLTPGLPGDAADAALLDLERRCEHYVTRPLVRSYRSLLENVAALGKRMESISERLTSHRRFKNEKDKRVLLFTASAFEALRATSKTRKRWAGAGAGTGFAAIAGVKLEFLQHHEQVLLGLLRDLRATKLCFALRKNAAKNAGSADLLDADAAQRLLDGVEKAVEDAAAVLAEVGEDLTATSALPLDAEAERRLVEAEQEARRLLTEGHYIRDLPPELPARLDDESRRTAMQLGTKSSAFGRKEYARLKESYRRLRDMMEVAAKHRNLSQAVSADIMDAADAIANKASERMQLGIVGLQNLMEEKNARAALEELANMNVNGLLQNAHGRQMSRLELAGQLFTLLEIDVSDSTEETRAVAKRITPLTEAKVRKYEELQGRFEAAKKGLKKAHNLLDAAEVAAVLRSYLVSVEGLLFPPGKADRA